MNRKRNLFSRIVDEAIVAVVREESTEAAYQVARAYARGGMKNIEITLTTPEALSIIAELSREFATQNIVIAAGSVRSADDAAQARKAGASIIVSPHTDLRVIEYSAEHDLLCVAGAATTTEIITAWNAGADVIKVYPVAQFGGAAYIRTIRQPIRDVPMLAGGPVPLDQIVAYLDAGAIAVNLGGSLAEPALVKEKKWDDIAERASSAVAIVGAHKGHPVEATVH